VPEREAEEARPWREDSGVPQPTVHLYPRIGRPVLWVYTGGAWRWAPVGARHDWPDGRVAYQCEVRLVDRDGVPYTSERVYVWGGPGVVVADPGRTTPTVRP
jgi:hypothetical protein